MKLIAGPMATVSHTGFRILVEQFGFVDEYYTEMINAGTLLTGGTFEKFYIDPNPVPEKVVWQLTGKDGENMVKAAKVLCELPGLGLDVNMGCSAPDIYRYGAGISWMIKPREETKTMIQGLKKVVDETLCEGQKKRFSVKLRLGDDDFTDEGFFSFCDMLVLEGVELLTLHPRTKKEKLARPARYHYAEDLKKRYGNDVQVYVNGNIKDENSFRHVQAVCPSVDGIMISRASVEKPWIFRQLSNADPFTINMEETALKYVDLVEQYQPPEFWKTRLQRFFSYYAMNFKFSHYAQTMFLNAADNNDLRKKIGDFFEKCPDERFKPI